MSNTEGNSPLRQAASAGEENVAIDLLANGADMDEKSNVGETPINAALPPTICTRHGCEQCGTKSCASCGSSYCCRDCQIADWLRHKEECQGHMQMIGSSNISKSYDYYQTNNLLKALDSAELALKKLKQLTRVDIEDLDNALNCKYNALEGMNRHGEALECATERYNLWAISCRRHHYSIEASFPLVASLISNEHYEQAHLIAGTLYEMTLFPLTNDIPEKLQQLYLAQGSFRYAQATLKFAQAGGIPPEEMQYAGNEAYELTRKALKIHKQLYSREILSSKRPPFPKIRKAQIKMGILLHEICTYFNGDGMHVIDDIDNDVQPQDPLVQIVQFWR